MQTSTIHKFVHKMNKVIEIKLTKKNPLSNLILNQKFQKDLFLALDNLPNYKD